MRFKNLLYCLVLSAFCASPLFGEETQRMSLSLSEVMMRARRNSVDAEVALNQLKSAYWEYRSYRAELLPEVSLNATLPSYRKQYSSYMNNDGSYSFVRNNYLQMDGELSVTQNIWLTGGKVSVNTSLDFYRQLGSPAFNRYMTIPVALTLTQPIFGVNNLKWDRRIEPVRYSEAKAQFLSATENVALTAINYYFSLLMAQENHSIAEQNLENAERLYEVAKEKREMGRISQNDLLQMELNLLNAKSDLTDCVSDLKSNMFNLRSFLDYGENVDIVPEIPVDVPEVEINYGDALEKALANNKFAKNMLRRQLEADYEVAKAKGAQREINLFAQIGYTGTDKNFAGGYQNLKDNQVVEIGFEIPLVDWGRRKGKVKVAESNRKLVESQVRQENMNFNQNLFILVERYGNQLRQLETARRADEIAQKRYATNVETFLIGKISTLDLNDSRVKKDEARREYVNELYRFWNYYYQIRSLTLWDYQKDTGIDADFDSIIK
ncbi:TolC family protein [Lepagella muris]|uniref:TolC family protein n=1 Tax=Lepagella muris TaxID=3032870 RepID=A0AC61RC53_9BACT|nr:TolC family protein [Lepagella muris]TGY77942.1 TolC family protein [Lepagella muris]THG51398.1 TolC family protein [Bacteroidales bacterium]TKC56369.1 TolC family protein [Bacteroidales bacterium]